MIDVLEMKHMATSIISLDASKCYDRIYSNIGGLELRILNASHEMCITVAKTAQHTKHRVRTVYGMSPKCIQAPTDEIWSGLGQGSGASCPSWLAIQYVLMRSHRHYCPGTMLTDPTGQLSFTMQVISYIDDNNMIYCHEEHETQENIQNKLSHTYNKWSQLLRTTGGQLNDKKCTVQNWSWTLKGNQCEMEDQCVKIFDEGTSRQIQYKSVNERQKYLGININPKNDYQIEFNRRYNDAKTFVGLLNRVNTMSNEVWMAHNSYWISSLTYCMPHVLFTIQQWQRIQSVVLESVLPKLRVNRHMPRAMV